MTTDPGSKTLASWPWCRRLVRGLQVLVLVMPAGAAAATPSPSSLSTQLVLDRTDEVWRYLGSNTGGYSDILSFTEPPQLNATTWNLAIAEQRGIDLPDLDQQRTVRWLEELLRRPELERGWYEVEVIDMATQTLVRLGAAPSPETVISRLEPLRVDWGYAPNRGEPADWSSTSIAIRAITAVDATPPAATVAAVSRQLEDVVAANATAWVERGDFISIWGVADRVLPME